MILTKECICHWLANVKLSRIILLVTLALVIVPLFTHYYISNVERDRERPLDVHRSRTQLEAYEDYSALKASDLRMRIQEMLRIKGSVSTELRDLEAKRQRLQSDVVTFTHKIEQLKSELGRQQSELNRLKLSVQQAEVAHREAVQRNSPELGPPLPLVASSGPGYLPPPGQSSSCTMSSCFDHSRCSLASGFPVYLYDTSLSPASQFLKTAVSQTVGYNPHFTSRPANACIYLVLLGEGAHLDLEHLNTLPYWGGDGRNHVLLHLSRTDLRKQESLVPSSKTGRAIIAQFTHPQLRREFDVVLGTASGPPGGDVWAEASNLLPARRRYLFSFQGVQPVPSPAYFNVSELESYLSQTSDEILMDVSCPPDKSLTIGQEDWGLCGTEESRATVLKQSTFALLPAKVSSPVLGVRLYEALKAAAIPILVGDAPLPYQEVVRWRSASLRLLLPRVPELHFMVRSIPDADILYLKRQGRLIWERYLSSLQAVMDTLLALIRDRLQLPPPPALESPAPSAFPDGFQPVKTEPIVADAEPEESLGPLEPPYPSPAFKRNFSLFMSQGYEMWNVWGDPFRLYPQLPFDPLLPSDAKFIGSGMGFRPIGGGAGGAGKEFCESLGGNSPREQFTIVMLTYEREQELSLHKFLPESVLSSLVLLLDESQNLSTCDSIKNYHQSFRSRDITIPMAVREKVLMNSLSRLHGLPYLNKVVVVWNSPRPPLQDLRWPEIGVPVHVVKGSRNSLNNRFLPYDAIETEAVLSVDDDAHLRHDEIIFGFRVWREERERVVGFPGRFHALDLNNGGWLYNSNYSCELSMVLTGAAFIHKYYMYLYTNWLPQAIRDKVDEYMNCEDIAMNFLVSHITRKPPVKVTSRWTFRCPGCPISLSEDDTHFQERHKCINFFTQVFGYTPLLNTQFRADSILFKTRIPHDKQKCFKFI